MNEINNICKKIISLKYEEKKMKKFIVLIAILSLISHSSPMLTFAQTVSINEVCEETSDSFMEDGVEESSDHNEEDEIQSSDKVAGDDEVSPNDSGRDTLESKQEENVVSSENRSSASQLITGVWGTVPWTYDLVSSTIVLRGGEVGLTGLAPWRTYTDVEQIFLEDRVILGSNAVSLFRGLTQLKNIQGIEKFDTANVTNMNFMFQGASSITELDLSQWDMSNVTSTTTMFAEMSNLKKLDISSWHRSIQVINMFRATSFEQLTLGTGTRINGTWLSNIPATETYTGRWVLQDSLASSTNFVSFASSTAFMSGYNGANPGVYVWEETIDLEAQVRPQTILLGEGTQDIDLGSAIHTVTADGVLLSSGEYDVTYIDSSSYLYIGDRFKDVTITYRTVHTLSVRIPISVRWGNTIRLRGTWANNFEEWRTIAAFTHHVGESGPELSLSPGRGGTNPTTPMIQQLPNQEFASLHAYSGSATILVNQGQHFFDFTLSTQQTPAEAQQDFENAVGENGRLQLSVGDIVSATHLFSSGEEFDGALAGFSNLEWNVLMQDEAEENVGTDHTNHKNSAFYEVTATNLRPLVINQLKPLLNNEVWQYISEEELLVVAESFFDFDIAEGHVSIAEIIEMPDTNQPGDSSMVVRVQEKLSSGQYAQMDYTVPVTIRPLQVSPKDPENPQEELHPEVMPELPENQGFLSIDFVPTIQFGDQEISYFAPETLYAEPLRTTANETRANFVQVSDRRGRNQSDGWRLSVKQREQFKNSETGHVLAGASLQFHHIQAIAASGQENQPTHSEQLSLLPGVSSTVAQAQAGSGLETWLFAFGTTDQAAESVVLHLESEQERQTGTYETTVEWILQSVPDNVIQ